VKIHVDGPVHIGSASVFNESDLENRRRMLKMVRKIWIEGVLHKSIWNQARIILNLTDQPDAVIHPCDLALRRAGRSDTLIPPGTSIIEVYHQEQEELLLLGEPGSGKTTLILEIAEALLREAERDPVLPIPVIFNLSAWRKENDRSAWREENDLLGTWLVEQLNQDYLVPPKIGKRWVESGALLLLLDGLDEVAESRRAACVEAINTYRRNHQAVLRPMVVCCRTQEYAAIPRLQLSGAVVIQPLTEAQVDGYLSGGGSALDGLRAVLNDEPGLYRELFSTPLMLHVAIVTYEGQSAEELRHYIPIKERRRLLWDAYIERMFERKQVPEPQYEKAQAIAWLEWLGKYLTHKDLQKYLIEGMQPDDLPRRWETLLVPWLPAVVLASIVFWICLLINNRVLGIMSGLVWLSMGCQRYIQMAPRERDVGRPAILEVAISMVVGAVFGVVGGAVGGVVAGVVVGAVAGVVRGAVAAAVAAAEVAAEGAAVFRAVAAAVGGAILGVVVDAGVCVFQHYLLRLLLWRSGRFPYNITPFLDWTAQRALVQRVGGGWRFVHRTLQERFAERYDARYPSGTIHPGR
jgi:DNA polymerase III delta prime subunit